MKIKPPINRNRTLLILTLLLTVFGLVMVYNASVVDALRDFGDKNYYFNYQLRWGAVGILGMLMLSRFPAGKLKNLAVPIWIATLILLIAVIIPGVGNKYLGARRWLGVGTISIQPAEAAKFSLAIYLAALLSKKPKLLPFLVNVGLAVALIMIEPDMGTAIVIAATSFLIYLTSGASLRPILLLSPILLGIGLIFILTSPYRTSRLMTFINSDNDPQGTSYHIHQALIALGSGGVTGVGLGQSRQKYQYLPEVTTDSIFAVVGEELGFLGTSSLVIAFLGFAFLGISIASSTPDNFEKLLAIGITGWISCQALINLSAIVGLIPLTGIPLPFISYGGSSLVVALSSVGILISIGRTNSA